MPAHVIPFMYPISRQFPFDEVCEKIVRALEKRNWQVPNITVEFDTYNKRNENYRYVRSISGCDFKLDFSRKQRNLAHCEDIAAVSRLTIPYQQICVKQSEYGPIFYLYVGDQWEIDKANFMNNLKGVSKLNKEPRTYLVYTGRQLSYPCQRPLYLDYTDDCGREYSPIGKEPTVIILEDKLQEFQQWLENNVLNYILSFPEANSIDSSVITEQLIPYQGPWPLIFSAFDWHLKEKVKTWKNTPELIDPSECHILWDLLPRLIPLDLATDTTLPSLAYDGFMWCSTKQTITQESSHYNLAIYHHTYPYIVAIQLKYANHIYVIDEHAFDETSSRIFQKIAPRLKLSDEELQQAYAARAKTLIPLAEYKGNYTSPIVLIHRDLDLDEIVWVQNEAIDIHFSL